MATNVTKYSGIMNNVLPNWENVESEINIEHRVNKWYKVDMRDKDFLYHHVYELVRKHPKWTQASAMIPPFLPGEEISIKQL